MKRMRVTLELIENDETLYSRQCEFRPCDGIPGRDTMVKTNGSGLQIESVHEAERFWQEIILMGFLDEYIRDRHHLGPKE